MKKISQMSMLLILVLFILGSAIVPAQGSTSCTTCSNNQFLIPAGSGTAPGLSYENDQSMGLSREAPFDIPSNHFTGDVTFGKITTTPSSIQIPDFRWVDDIQKLKVRSLFITDIGDSIDLGLRRVGPDNVGPYHWPPEAVGANKIVGFIYWEPWGTQDDYAGRIAEIYARTAEIPTATSNAGSLEFTTTPIGKTKPIERMIIDDDGRVGIGTRNPNALLHVNGKAIISGGVDPPYVSFSSETHESIRNFAKDVEEHETVMEFWNNDSHRMEIYIINEDKFYTMTGEPSE
jgi:hypothetical protein